ncbi:MAG TPA: hypothetical protein VGM56_23380, partial [Byssovorax sp.]
FGGGPMTNPRYAGEDDLIQGDAFLARFTSAGGFVYQKQIATTEAAQINVAAGADGDTYVFSGFGDYADLGDGVRVTSTTAQYDTLFARIDAAGNVVVAERLPDSNGAPLVRDALGMTVAPSGDVYVWGLESVESDEMHVYVTRLTPDGEVVWSRTAAATDGLLFVTSGYGSAAALPNGGIALSITYFGDGADEASIDFGDGALAVVPAGQGSAAFVAAYDDAGTALFARSLGQADGPSGPSGYDVGLSAGGDGTLYAIGYYEGTVDVGTGPMSGAPGTYVAALGLDGSTKWATNLEGVEAGAVAPTPSGGVVVSLTCDTACNFGAGPIDTSAGLPLVLVELDAAGNLTKSTSFGPGDVYGETLAVDPSGAIVVAGTLLDSVDICGDDLWSAGDRDMFVARLAPL